MSESLTKLEEKIANKICVTAVIGLGYVGLPLCASMLAKGLKVKGFDIDPDKIEQLANNKSYIQGVPDAVIEEGFRKALFSFSCDFSGLSDVDVIVICVPTPLDQNNKPDLSYVEKTARSISEYLRASQMVILESTSYPGTMRDVVIPILEESGLREGSDFYAVFSPEREDPGNRNFSTSSIPKLVGAARQEALALAVNFYRLFIEKVVPVSSMEVAEAAKITENVFRAVNIAFVNELKTIYDRMGIDVWEVIEAAATKPFGFMPFYPGPGIGGHCIPVDPYYLSWKAEQVGQKTRFIELAGEINLSMRDYIVTRLEKALDEKHGKSLSDSHILILGVAYKKNVGDQRESPATRIMEKLLELGARLDFHDPHIETITPMRRYPQFTGTMSAPLNADTIGRYDAAVIVTDHDDVDYALVARQCPVIIDTRNVIRKLGLKVSGHLVQA